MTVRVVGDAGVVEGETWYLRREGILNVWRYESVLEMVRGGRINKLAKVNESRGLVREYAEIMASLFGRR